MTTSIASLVTRTLAREIIDHAKPRLAHFRRLLKSVEIGEPVKSWLSPHLTLAAASVIGTGGSGGGGNDPPMIDVPSFGIRLDVRVIDTNTPRSWFGRRPRYLHKISLRQESITSAYVSDAEFITFVRSCLHEMVTHEVDEAISIGGVKRFDPHASLRAREVP